VDESNAARGEKFGYDQFPYEYQRQKLMGKGNHLVDCYHFIIGTFMNSIWV
jgi:hypothetical protein